MSLDLRCMLYFVQHIRGVRHWEKASSNAGRLSIHESSLSISFTRPEFSRTAMFVSSSVERKAVQLT